MLYLEDYLEMIENLPMDMRDRFTEMREMDLQVQNAMDSLEDRVKKFFERCNSSANLKPDWKDEQFNKLKEEYGKALEDADEKVHLTAQIYDLLDRYLRKLDMELQKFKLELEADNAGITEMLEKRSLELDNPPSNQSSQRGETLNGCYFLEASNAGEKPKKDGIGGLATTVFISMERKFSQLNSTNSHSASSEKRMNHGSGRGMMSHSGGTADKAHASLNNDSGRESLGGSTSALSSSQLHSQLSHSHSQRSISAANSPATNMFSSSSMASTPALTYNLGHVGAGSNAAIAAAASRAIGATLEMQHGRRTASLKASYEAVKSAADLGKDFSLQTYTAAATGASSLGAALASGSTRSEPTTPTSSGGHKKNKKSVLKNKQATQASQLAQQLAQAAAPAPSSAAADVPEVAAEETSVSGWAVDPNEPRYCVCNDVSYGDMVGCDNDDCPIEWFHYGCVGLTSAPRGKWYCPQCTVAMKRRGRK